jgi:hypothetical protein
MMSKYASICIWESPGARCHRAMNATRVPATTVPQRATLRASCERPFNFHSSDLPRWSTLLVPPEIQNRGPAEGCCELDTVTASRCFGGPSDSGCGHEPLHSQDLPWGPGTATVSPPVDAKNSCLGAAPSTSPPSAGSRLPPIFAGKPAAFARATRVQIQSCRRMGPKAVPPRC